MCFTLVRESPRRTAQKATHLCAEKEPSFFETKKVFFSHFPISFPVNLCVSTPNAGLSQPMSSLAHLTVTLSAEAAARKKVAGTAKP